jgi:palmitoyltransferase
MAGSYLHTLQHRYTATMSFSKKVVGIGFKALMRILGPLMILGANVLIGGIVYAFLFHVVPDLCGDSRAHFSLHLLVGFYLLGNIMFNYMACVGTSPGHPEPCHDPIKYLGGKTSVSLEGKKLLHFNYKVQLEPGVSYRWCRHCKCIKPPRAHHDSITGRCVLDMDHFCPWMNNCVGYHNYRYFILFMLYLFFGCLYVQAVVIVQFRRFNKLEGAGVLYYRNLHDALVYSFTVAMAAMVSVGILLSWHLYLCMTNQTTIEFYINMEERADAKEMGLVFKNPFDKGWRKNLKRVFGDGSWYSVILLSLRNPPTPLSIVFAVNFSSKRIPS